MRVFAAALLSMGLLASPLLAKNAGETSKGETSAAVMSAAAEKPKEAVKPESAAIESEVQDLRSLVEEQRAELEAQRAALKAQQLKMEALEVRFGARPSEPTTGLAATPAATPSATPVSTAVMAQGTPAATAAKPAEEKPSPLYFKIGGAEFFPLGFMDMTGFYRTTQLGGIGTGFGSIAYNNALPAGRISEARLTAQNSRIGLRTHAKFGAADVTGYLEADFLGFLAPNGHDTSNSDSLRLRLYWVDYKMGKFEMLGGQSWSFLTPNRTGLGALPGELFYSQDVDTNYQLGLTWTRQTGIRFLYHPTNNWTLGVSFENPQQTLPSSVVLPAFTSTGAALSSTGAYGGQFDTNSSNNSNSQAVNNTNVPNLHPDIILKTAFDAKPGGHQVHFDVAGLFRSFKAVNLIDATSTAAATKTSTIHGGGVAATMNLELVKNLRLITTGFYSDAGGRYIASTAGPDLIVKPDGTLSGIHSGSGIGGFEWQPNPKTLIYAYYSGAYFGQNVSRGFVNSNVPTTGTGATGTCTVTGNYGYGDFGAGTSVLNAGAVGTCPTKPGASPNSANRYIFEPTFGIHYYMWRNPNYGDIRLMTQYSYVSRTPWLVAAGAPSTAHLSMIYVNLRYDLP
jgi:TolA-binding protein